MVVLSMTLIQVINNRSHANELVRMFEAELAAADDKLAYIASIRGAMRHDKYYEYSDDHREWSLGEAQYKIMRLMGEN